MNDVRSIASSSGQAQGYESLLAAARCLARHWTHTPEDADDLAQEALLRLVSVRKEVHKPVALLTVIVRRLAWRQVRSAPAPLLLFLGTEVGFDPWQYTEQWLDLRSAVESLPRRTQQALALVAAGHTEREIAQALRCSIKVVEKVLYLGRSELRRHFSSARAMS